MKRSKKLPVKSNDDYVNEVDRFEKLPDSWNAKSPPKPGEPPSVGS